ncbi:MAG: NAD(P)-dependent oxidoreductase [Deinococcota bacterium]
MSEAAMNTRLLELVPNLTFSFEPNRDNLSKHLETVTILVDGSANEVELDAPNLKHLIVPWAGVTHIRDKLLARPNLSLHNSHYNAPFVAQHSIAMMFAAMHRLFVADRHLRQGDWTMRNNPELDAMLLTDTTVLLLGYGAIGKAVARLLHPLGLNVTILKRNPVQDEAINHCYTPDDLPDALANADVVICSLPLTPTTEGLLDANALSHLKEHSILINVGRGRVIDEAALYQHLQTHSLCVAALDVWWRGANKHPDTPSYPANKPFWELLNVIMSPHRADQVKNSNHARFEDVASTIAALCKGEMRNQVDVGQGY